MKVSYVGPLKDYSGYGEANRHFLAALDAVGVDVYPKLLTYTTESSDFGTLGERIEHLFDKQGDVDIQIMHTTPNEFHRFVKPELYNIGHFFWETDLVPKEFADGLKLCDEIWTGSVANKNAILKAGVNKPIVIIPQPIETDRKWPVPYDNKEFDNYLFYSIFEWTDRKNPEALLNAYWQEFQDGENVALLIKTYFRNFTSTNKFMIRSAIERLKARSGLKHFPPVYLYLDLMDREQVMRLHVTGDAYVSAHHGEGWGVPQVEAALAGNLVISTGYGGCHEYFEHGKDALLIPYTMQKLRGMDHSSDWYTNDQKWAGVDQTALRAAMRYAYSEQSSADLYGLAAQNFVMHNFNFEVVGRMMKQRLQEIAEMRGL